MKLLNSEYKGSIETYEENNIIVLTKFKNKYKHQLEVSLVDIKYSIQGYRPLMIINKRNKRHKLNITNRHIHAKYITRTKVLLYLDEENINDALFFYINIDTMC